MPLHAISFVAELIIQQAETTFKRLVPSTLLGDLQSPFSIIIHHPAFIHIHAHKRTHIHTHTPICTTLPLLPTFAPLTALFFVSFQPTPKHQITTKQKTRFQETYNKQKYTSFQMRVFFLYSSYVSLSLSSLLLYSSFPSLL